jgi:hypothetical protein
MDEGQYENFKVRDSVMARRIVMATNGVIKFWSSDVPVCFGNLLIIRFFVLSHVLFGANFTCNAINNIHKWMLVV